MAAKKATAYQAVGALVVIRKGGHERYLDRGAVFGADQVDEANAEHLLSAGLIKPFEAPVAEAHADADAEAAAKATAEAEAKAAAEKAEAEKAAKQPATK